MASTPIAASPATRRRWSQLSWMIASGSAFSIRNRKTIPKKRPGRMQYSSDVSTPPYDSEWRRSETIRDAR